ncbi:hypothetical protein EYD45_12075 [Hyunsoonleella flava]|uniref:Protein BatD n=1 Tax=Hyunsoonleella flava TaxID=2527939 RepID=A0A4V2JA35_9FLAO|nr:hypothetical protein [Hyunsoonleella flava]TBN02440.1 hypothetical protein EYD45_12075 [Hyunsoonleella flava]
MSNELRFMKAKYTVFGLPLSVIFSFLFIQFSFFSFAQVTSSIDSTSIKIGEQITYNIQVETDTTSLVVFPEGQTFSPLEMIESYPIDTVTNQDKFNLIKKYGLTQFDSGAYTIPRQKIIVGDNTFFTDSLKVEVRNIEVDTTKQGLYDIKPIIEVKKRGGNWWKYLLITLLVIGVIAAALWWFIWRQKPLTEEEKIALLPPYDRAKLALQKLDESHYLEHQQLKDYYSELTLIIRKYLDEKVYDHSLESTTDELISKLRLLKDGNQIDLSAETIKNLESILRRADLVKFAKSAPDVALAELDRKTIDAEIDHVKEVLPEPTEEEKLLDEQYREEQERKKQRKKIWLTVGISVFLLLAALTGFSLKYGFDYVKDTIVGHESKELLEGDWVTSQYGVPPITISTPRVLKRVELPVPDEVKGKVKTTTFVYGTLIDVFSVSVSTTTFPSSNKNKIELEQVSEGSIKGMESQGAKNITVFRDKFTTPNGAEGLKTYGTLTASDLLTKKEQDGNYVLLQFLSQNVLQQIIITYPNDTYAKDVVERIVNSVELKNEEE